MINNRQNGRRRGRGGGGGQRQGGGGGQGPRDSGNRIDSRARGNANQMLEKYRNMARDAQMSGDRVQTEYYLQFADHYFRVLADQRGRFDDGRGDQPQRRPRDEFDQFDQFDGDDFDDEMEARTDDVRVNPGAAPMQPRGGTDTRERSGDEAGRDGARDGNRDAQRDGQRDRPRANGGGERPMRTVPVANDLDGGDEQPAEARRARRGRLPQNDAGAAPAAAAAPVPVASEQEGIADRLPPSFGYAVEGERVSEGDPVDDAPRPRRRRTRVAGGEAGSAS